MGKKEQALAFVEVPGSVVFTRIDPDMYDSPQYRPVLLHPEGWSANGKKFYKTLTGACKHSVKLGRFA